LCPPARPSRFRDPVLSFSLASMWQRESRLEKFNIIRPVKRVADSFISFANLVVLRSRTHTHYPRIAETRGRITYQPRENIIASLHAREILQAHLLSSLSVIHDPTRVPTQILSLDAIQIISNGTSKANCAGFIWWMTKASLSSRRLLTN
jgi:hypothetical protein